MRYHEFASRRNVTGLVLQFHESTPLMLSVEARLSELLTRWETLQRSGYSVTAEELCSDDPELADALRHRIEVLSSGSLSFDAETTDGSAHRPIGGQPASTLAEEIGRAVDSSVGVVIGDFEILGELGHGGMGVVYRAYDRENRRVVALKTMLQGSATALYRFKQEFRALADVSHPNLVMLHELVAHGSHWYLTMELIEGTDFLTYVRTATLFPDTRTPEALPAARIDRLRLVLRQLAEGIAVLHGAGMLHRDIKPSNVLVEKNGRVILLDFGLSAELEPSGLHQSTEAHVLGTVAYMSPEQAAGQPVSPSSDWYSVGVMLYEALTGRLPFAGKAVDLLHEKQRSESRPPRDLAPETPEDLNALCISLLSRDPSARPSGTGVLRLLSEASVLLPFQPGRDRRAPLVGRDRHLEILRDALETVEQVRTVAISVHGGSGAGKSALVQHFLDDLIEHGEAVVLAGRCYERESVPYKAFDSLVDSLSRYLSRQPRHETQAILPRDVLSLARVFPVLQRVEAVALAPRKAFEIPDLQELRRRAFAALRELLGRLGDRGLLVLAIDDLQWGDADSVALLVELLRPPDPPSLLLVGCYRSEDSATPFVRSFLAAQEAAAPALDRRELVVDPLSRAEVERLVLELLGRDDPSARICAFAIARESGGNPFFVQELVHSIKSGAGREESLVSAQAIALDEVLWDRVSRLPTAARRLLEIVAVSGRPLRQIDATRAAALGPDELEALSILRSGRLIRSTGPTHLDEVEAYHDRVRETVVAHLTLEVLERHHLDLARVLEASGKVDPEFLAIHYQEGNERPKAGVYYAKAAAQASAALAFDRATKLYRLALQFRPADGASEQSLRTELGDALANAGRSPEAAREYLAAISGTAGAEALELRRRAAYRFLISGHIDEGLIEVRKILRAVGLKLPESPVSALFTLLQRRVRLRLRGLGFRERDAGQIPRDELIRIDTCLSTATGLNVVDPIRGAAIQAQSLLFALRAGEPSRLVSALAWEAAQISVSGAPSRRRVQRLLDIGQALAERGSKPQSLGSMVLAHGLVAYLAGSWREARFRCEHAEAIFRDRCTGATWELDTAQTFALWSLTYMGEVAELARRRQVLLKEALERGDLYALTNLSTYIMAIVQLGADQPDDARRELDQAVARWSQKGFHVQHHNALLARLYIEIYTGNGAIAWNHASDKWPSYARSLLLRVQQVRIDARQLHARCALAAAVNSPSPAALLRAAQRDARHLERERTPWARAHAVFLRGAIAHLRGDSDAARAALLEAASAYETADMPLYAAAIRRRLGEILGGCEGSDLITGANAWMAQQSLRDPARITAMYAPGFRD